MVYENLSWVVSLIGLVSVLGMALKEKWFVKRSTVSTNGTLLIIAGIANLITKEALYIFNIPLGIFLAGYGIVTIRLINSRWDTAKKMGNSKITLVILLLNILIQAGILYI